MSTETTDEEIEKALLEKLRDDLELNPDGCLTIKELCCFTIETLNPVSDIKDDQRRVLTGIYDLFLKGYLAWGRDFDFPNPPLCHITHRGKEILKRDVATSQ